MKVLAQRGIEVMLLDLDNTLAPWRTKDFSAQTINWLNQAKKAFDIYILSNGSSDRWRIRRTLWVLNILRERTNQTGIN